MAIALDPGRRCGLILGLILLAGCASPRPVSVLATSDPAVSSRYEQGRAVLASSKTNDVSITVLDATETDLLFEVAVRNGSTADFDFSTDNVSLVLADSNQTEQAGKVYTYEELAARGDKSLAWDSASIVTGAVVPSVVGATGAAGAVVSGFIGLGMGEARRRSNASVEKPAAETYLRRQTITATAGYSAVVKIGLPQAPQPDDKFRLTVKTPQEEHEFVYTIKS